MAMSSAAAAAATQARSALQPYQRLPSQLHAAAIASGVLQASNDQAAALPYLDELSVSLPGHSIAMRAHTHALSRHERARKQAVDDALRPSSPFAAALHRLRLLCHGYTNVVHPASLPDAFYRLRELPAAPSPPQGLYLYGDVGSGKTLLMDMLFASAPPAVPASRVHYHPFMVSVYESIHQYDSLTPWDRGEAGWRHPLDAVVSCVAPEPCLLCFDELQIADVGDARLMHGIFKRLMHAGSVVCFTANRPPDAINRSQLRDDDFRPFLDLLQTRCRHVRIEGLDYRSVLDAADAHGGNKTPCYLAPHDESGLRELWCRDTRSDWDDVVTAVLPVAYGRTLTVTRASPSKAAVQMHSSELLDAPVGAADYRALARSTRAIFFTDVLPVFTSDTRNLARRFITLVDVCYEEKVRLVMRMEAGDVDDMFSRVDVTHPAVHLAEGLQFESEVAQEGVGAENRSVGSGTLYTGEDEAFAFRRATSRLREMRTSDFGRRRPVSWDD